MKNKFDQRIFAIKQVRINPREDLKKVLQEVENLSKVGKHKNVVKYLDCFLIQEEVEFDDEEDASNDNCSSQNDNEYPNDTSSFLNFDDNVSNLQQVKKPSENNTFPSSLSSSNSLPDLIPSQADND